MKLRIEIDKRYGRNVHVLLRGVAGDSTGCDDSEIFTRYVEVCKAFGEGQYLRNEAVFDVFKAGARDLAASAV
jgi:hypothetical protein